MEREVRDSVDEQGRLNLDVRDESSEQEQELGKIAWIHASKRSARASQHKIHEFMP